MKKTILISGVALCATALVLTLVSLLWQEEENSKELTLYGNVDVRQVDIDTQPAMQIMADGNALGEGRVRIEVRRRILAVMVSKTVPEPLADPGAILEAQTHAAAG